MITADQVMPLLLEACPSFRDPWESEIEHNPTHVDDSGHRLQYVDAGDFGRHLVWLFKEKRFDEIQSSFAVIERLHIEGDPFVRELATIGYLETLQNIAGWDEDLEPSVFERFLGPESGRWWESLNRFWAGETPAVIPLEE